MTPSDRARECGFTLLEVLVSMAIGVVLIFFLTEALNATQVGWIRANAAGDRLAQQRRAEDVLRSALANVQAPAPDEQDHRLLASERAFEFITLPPQSETAQGPMRATLKVEPGREGQLNLVLALAPVSASRTSPPSQHLLLSYLASAKLIYYYAGDDKLTTNQAIEGAVPALIVVRWSYPDARSDASEIAVRPRVSLSGSCNVDLSSGKCRVR